MLNGISTRSQQNQTHRNYKYRRLSKSDSEGDQDDESQEHIELLNRGTNIGKLYKSTKLSDYDKLFERPIHQGESLASISLKYRISVADLKRVNRLHKEAEFYALSSVKIPVKQNTVLYEVLEEELNENRETGKSVTPLGARISSSSEPENEVDNTPSGVISISQICREKQTRTEAKMFLQNMQKDLQKLQEKTNSYKNSLDEAATSLTNVAFSPLENRMFTCSDRDLSWWRVLAFGATVVVVVPIIYLSVSLLQDS